MASYNSLSGGNISVAMALLYPKLTNVMINTGGNLLEVWKRLSELQLMRIKIIVISSFIGGYQSYYDYIKNENLLPFYMSCNYKAKRLHMNRFYGILAPCTVNIGLTAGEEDRRDEFQSTDGIRYNFPMIKYTREECEKILRAHDLVPLETRSGCWFCPKQPRSSWIRLRKVHPELYQEAKERGWLTKLPH